MVESRLKTLSLHFKWKRTAVSLFTIYLNKANSDGPSSDENEIIALLEYKGDAFIFLKNANLCT